MFNANSRTDLEEKLEYERWVLEFIAEERKLFGRGDTKLKFDSEGNKVVSIAVNDSISQNRVNKLISELYPLVFVAAYKTLDAQMEWILEENGESPSGNYWHYEEKVNRARALYNQGNLTLPPIFSNNINIFERFLELYDDLRDHRNTIIHRDDFELTSDKLEITDSSNSQYTFSTEELFSLAISLVLVSEALVKNVLNDEKEREVKFYLDKLDFIHQKGQYNITSPWAPKAQVEVTPDSQDPLEWSIDVENIRDKTYNSLPEAQSFYLIVEGIYEENVICEWEIPSDVFDDSESITLAEESDEWDKYK